MDSTEAAVLIVLLVFLGAGIIAAVIGVFLFSDSNWWKKFF